MPELGLSNKANHPEARPSADDCAKPEGLGPSPDFKTPLFSTDTIDQLLPKPLPTPRTKPPPFEEELMERTLWPEIDKL